MDFALFIVLNAVMLLRPDDLFPDLRGYRWYLLTIVPTLLAAAPRLSAALNPSELVNRPITVCVLAFWAACGATDLARGQFGLATAHSGEFGKVVLYYLLLTAVVDSRERLRSFLGWLVALVGVLAGLSLLQFHGYIDLEAIKPIEGRVGGVDEATGEAITFDQMRAHGMFNDPNDLCLILVVGMAAAGYLVATGRTWGGSGGWLVPAGVFLYALTETRSRGGLLALLAATGAGIAARWGVGRAAVAGVLLVPAAAVLIGGRQTNLGEGGGGTVTQRVMFWNEGFGLLLSSTAGPQTPATGIGVGAFVEHIRHVAHNSFVHAYVETGVVGGTLFFGAFFLAGWGVWRVRPGRELLPGGTLAVGRPFVLGAVVGFAAGIFSLSRQYTLPTFLVLGVASAYLALALPAGAAWFRVNAAGVRVVALAGAGGLVFHRLFTYFYLRLMV